MGAFHDCALLQSSATIGIIQRHLLIIFVKAPRLGTVKTRLAATVGDDCAVGIYQQLVQRLLKGLHTLDQVHLCFSPADSRDEIASWMRPSWTASPQSDGDLGQKLFRAFENGLAGN